MRFFNKISSILLGSAVLLGLTTLSVSASTNQESVNDPANANVTAVKPASQQHVNVPPRQANNYYNRRQRGTHRIYQTGFRFTRQLGKNNGPWAHHWYKRSINYTRIAKNQYGTFVKTRYGWLNKNAFNQFVVTRGRLRYRMQVIHNGNLYNLPANTNNARKVASTRSLHLYHQWVNVNAVADTNLAKGYYRFGYQGQNYWIPGQDLMFNLKADHSRNRRLEYIIAQGEKMIDHSKYNEKTQRYDCASFLHHIFAKGGVWIGTANTYQQMVDGHRVSIKHLKRGDLVFFNTYYSEDAYGHKISGLNAHVAMYIGNGLILQDSCFTDNGGVDVSSLRDPMWNSHSKVWFVHYLNGIARRIL